MMVQTFIPSTQRQRPADLWEFDASLSYIDIPRHSELQGETLSWKQTENQNHANVYCDCLGSPVKLASQVEKT